jgi:hypothetical protein
MPAHRSQGKDRPFYILFLPGAENKAVNLRFMCGYCPLKYAGNMDIIYAGCAENEPIHTPTI